MKTKLGNGVFITGNCFDVMKSLPDNSINLVVSDVPYNEVNRKSSGLRNLNKGKADDSEFDEALLITELHRIVSGSIYLFCGFKQISFFMEGFKGLGWSARLGVWHKTNPSPMNGDKLWLSGIEPCVFFRKPKATFNEHCKSPVWTYPTQRSKLHPTAKPEILFSRLVEASSNPGDLVFDPFAGSGTTGFVCEKLNRHWINVELDTEYANIAIERIRNYNES